MQPEKIGIYEVKSELGRGGMATVYRAYDPRFEREVAVKVLPSELLHSDPQFRLRFEREAKIIAQLEHTAIVPVYDVGEADGQPYFVMRYMNGGSLSERIKAGGLTLEDAVRILGAIAPGLDEAHSKGIVHRDIKPSNILFDKRGNPYISDFGIAKLSQSGNVTGSAIIGTPAYMSPEQAQGTEIDGRADIYALGIILFEMLTGQQPYQADTPMAVAIKHITDPVPHIRKINPQLSEGVDAIIQKAMAKDKNERFATAVDMTNTLLEVARHEPTRLQTAPVLPRASQSTIKASAKGIPQKKGFNALFLIIPVLVLGALVVVAGGLFILNGGLSPAKTEAPASLSTSVPVNTEISAPTDIATEIPVKVETTSTDTPSASTDTPTGPAASAGLVLGGTNKIALVANNDIWLMNVDGSELKQLTTDGGAKSDLQWLPDGKTILFLSGKTIKFYDTSTDVVDTLATFPSASSLDAFQVSHDGKQAMISLNNEIFVIPFSLENMKGVSKKSDLLASEPCIVPKGKTKSALQVREMHWSTDDKLVAWLFKGPDASDQVGVFDILACDPEKIVLRDNFPGTRFNPVGFQSRIMGDFDWDGASLFAFNTSKRNNGWGELYIYNWESHKPTLIHPVSNKCCYRDARWSPDGTYLFFAFQDEGLAAATQTFLYYVPYGEIGTGATITPIPLPEGFFKSLKEAPQPALRPAQ